jgi:hypothetical protein
MRIKNLIYVGGNKVKFIVERKRRSVNCVGKVK